MAGLSYEQILAEVRGWYQPRNLVAFLNKDVDVALNTYDKSSSPSNNVKNAFATYLHEIIHWWQHIGTSSGLLMTLSLPAQSHANQKHLMSLASDFELKKPLSDYLRYFDISNPEELKLLNIIINNWHDMYFSRMLLCAPRTASQFVNDPVYESQAHSHLIHFGSILAHIESVCKGLKCRERAEHWMALLDNFKERKIPDFYFGSSVRLPYIGIMDIMEGHARFCDLQYRSYAGNSSSLDEYYKDGYLSERYLMVYNKFLTITGLVWPSDVKDPSINLFLFICDYALNTPYPYPFDPIEKFEEINVLFSPGARFTQACSLLKEQNVKVESLRLAATPCAQVYADLDNLFSRCLGYPSVTDVFLQLKTIWETEGDNIEFEKSYSSFQYTGANIFTRFVMSHHYEFIKWRIEAPHFLCWPARFASTMFASEIEFKAFGEFFNKHDPPLMLDEKGVVKVSRTYISSDAQAPPLLGDLLSFFVMYDLTDRLITERGEFDFSEYKWFSDNFTIRDFKSWLEPNFVRYFGVPSDKITVLEI